MFELPSLDPRVLWSLEVRDVDLQKILLSHQPNQQLRTASIGKIFLLIAVAEAEQEGLINFDDRLSFDPTLEVADSGLLYLFRDRAVTVYDAALLVAAVSDNLATNALISLLGRDNCRNISRRLGLNRTELHDYIRNERTADMPWTPSFGTAQELCTVMELLHRGQAFSPAISQQVLSWLAANTDTSMLADAFALDPLAHQGPEYQGVVLRHKTGSTDVIRVDCGVVTGAKATVAYAVGANWVDVAEDLRVPVIESMRFIGEQIRAYVTGREKSDFKLSELG